MMLGSGSEVVVPPLEPDATNGPTNQQANHRHRDHPPPSRHPGQSHGWDSISPTVRLNYSSPLTHREVPNSPRYLKRRQRSLQVQHAGVGYLCAGEVKVTEAT